MQKYRWYWRIELVMAQAFVLGSALIDFSSGLMSTFTATLISTLSFLWKTTGRFMVNPGFSLSSQNERRRLTFSLLRFHNYSI
jgi:hypothetical protein